MRLCILMLAVALGMSGQEKKAEEAKPDTANYEAAIIPVKTLTGDSFDRLVRLLGVFHARFSADDKLRTIVVYAPKEVVTEMRRVIAELDKPGSEAAIGRNISLTLSFLKCTTKPSPGSEPLSPELEPVAKQLRAATQYKNVQLWDTVPMHIQEGRTADQSLRLPGGPVVNPGGAFATAQIKVTPESVGRKDGGRYVRFRELKIGFRMPVTVGNGIQYQDVGVNTAGDFMEGQKTVLGKVSGMEDDSAIFVVIALKILD